MRAISRRFYVGAYLGAFCVGVIVCLVALGYFLSGGRERGWTLLFIGVGLMVIAKAVSIVFIWRMWAAIKDGAPRLTPAKAVLPLFVPLFNFYWLFRAFRWFAQDFNRYAREKAGRSITISTRLPTTICVMALIPPAWPAIPVLFTGFISAVCDAVNAIEHGKVALGKVVAGRGDLPKTLIEVRNLTKLYGQVRAVNDVSFSVEKGEVVGFLGPNAAGKTTTMRIITSYMPATSGTALIAGHDVFSDSLEARRYIGYIPEGVSFYPEMRVIEYLKYRARLKGVPAWARPSAVAQSMERAGATDVSWKLIGSLSKGYRQRLAMADALVNDPPILIMDEPTIGLDPNQIIQVRAMIRELGKDHTVLLSTHILPEVEAVCKRVLIINNGRLVFAGLPDGGSSDAHGAGGSVRIEVRGPEDRLRTTLAAVAGVERVLPEGGGMFTLIQKPGADVREAVFRAMARNEWPIVEMQRKRASLEEVFVRLTAKEGLPSEAPAKEGA